MKKINIIFIVLFFVMLMIPIIFFDFREKVVSEIDNRALANNPLKDKKAVSNAGSLTTAIENYVSDRIGFRNFFIRSYTKLNDGLFNKMVHPSYEYGQDGYVFFARSTGTKLDTDDFYDSFINMLVKIKKYCDDKNVPFIFAFEPSKSSVIVDKVNSGINYDNSWLNEFFDKIEQNGINFVNNYPLLKEKYENGEAVFNKQYDAGHWNWLGAFYGVNNILEKMKEFFPKTHVNELSDFNKKTTTYDTLLVSEFPINEEVTEYVLKNKINDKSSKYKNDLILSSNYRHFEYKENDLQKGNSPSTLVFQGSYMNGYGYRFFENGLSKYVAVHNYDNILNFDYYFNIFKPECVVFEVTEYTLYGNYFNKNKLKSFDLLPDISTFKDYKTQDNKIDKSNISISKKSEYTTITVKNIPNDTSYAYVKINNQIYDLKKRDKNTYNVTILNDNYGENIHIITIDKNNKKMVIYK